MTIEHRKFGDIPTVLVCEDSPERAAEEGCILCYHGFTSSKDAWLHDLKILAKGGFLVIGVDAVGHGERRHPDFETHFSGSQTEIDEAFLRIVEESSAELPDLVDELFGNGLVLEHKLGMFGVSMGGFITYAAVLKEPRLSAAVTLVSSPEWWMMPSPKSPHNHPEAFHSIKLLSQTAGKDQSVPNHYAQSFHKRLREHYEDYTERFKYRDYPASNHQMNPDWQEALAETVVWFQSHLKG